MPRFPAPPACIVAALVALAGAETTASAAADVERLALVIGNSAYRSVQPLGNPTHDARLIARRLREVGFQVDTIEDADLPRMRAGLRAFAERVGRAGSNAVALLYYAGHGVQDEKNRNYLIPVDAQLKSQVDLVDGAVKVEYVQELIEDARPKISFLILDACRDNPLPATSRSAARGLAPIDSRTRGTFIAFSTSPGRVALDGEADGNGPYAAALAAELVRPAASFDETFRRAHLQVITSTNGQQTPWMYSNVVDEFSFVRPPAAPSAEAPAAAPTPAAAEPEPEPLAKLNDPDLEYQKAVLADSIAEYERFLQRFPRHTHRDTVVKLIALKREDMLWRQIELDPDANQQLRMLDRLVNAFPDGAYLDRAKRRRADLIDRLNPPAKPTPAPMPEPPVLQQAYLPPAGSGPPPRIPGAPQASPIQLLAAGRWAVGRSANCGVPGKTYQLAALGNAIRWRSGTGSIDVETIEHRSDTGFSTMTVESIRAQGAGMPYGSRWSYDVSDPSLVRVTPSGKRPFVLVPCR